MTTCNKPDFITDLLQLDEIYKFVAACIADKLQQAGKNDNLQQVYGVFDGINRANWFS